MCVIALIPKNTPMDNETLEKCYHANPDSIGYMFPKDGKLHLRRFLKWKDFLAKWKTEFNPEGMPKPFAVHFRIATSGGINLENCHPFAVTDGIAYMHNGVFSGLGDNKCSDTNMLRKVVLSPLFAKYSDPLSANEIHIVLNYIAGYSNKLVFMDVSGKALIINEKSGDWIKGVWFSNRNWEYKSIPFPPANDDYYSSRFFTQGQGKKAYDGWNRKEAILCFQCKDNYTFSKDGICSTCFQIGRP